MWKVSGSFMQYSQISVGSPKCNNVKDMMSLHLNSSVFMIVRFRWEEGSSSLSDSLAGA